MLKFAVALTVTFLMLTSQPALAAARLAVLHLAPFANTLDGTAVNIAVNGTVLFENVKFRDFVDYTELDAGEYTIDIIPVGELPLRMPVDNRSNGMWEIIEGSGTGFVFQPMPSQNRVVGTWYTYDELGVPTFLTFDSCLNETSDGETFMCAMPGGFDGKTATTALYLSTGGGPSEDDVVLTEKVGEVGFEIMGCNDAMAVVTLTGETPVMYTAR